MLSMVAAMPRVGLGHHTLDLRRGDEGRKPAEEKEEVEEQSETADQRQNIDPGRNIHAPGRR